MLLLGPNGGFLRDVLIEEVAKGLDAGWRYGADQAVTSLTSLLQARLENGPRTLANRRPLCLPFCARAYRPGPPVLYHGRLTCMINNP